MGLARMLRLQRRNKRRGCFDEYHSCFVLAKDTCAMIRAPNLAGESPVDKGVTTMS
jgi:hypothetical protein